MSTDSLFKDFVKMAGLAVEQAPVSDEAIAQAEEAQKTREWYIKRMGHFNASDNPNLMKTGQKKGVEWGDTAKKVIARVRVERTLTEKGIELYVAEQMSKEFRATKWGNTYEGEAREKLFSILPAEIKGDATCIEEIGSHQHPALLFFWGSADGKINGIPVELKCPFDPLVHEANLALDVIDESHTYYPQIQSHMMVHGTERCIFASYDPRRDDAHCIKFWVVEANFTFIAYLENRLREAEKMANEPYPSQITNA